jgi:tight adherence protein B
MRLLTTMHERRRDRALEDQMHLLVAELAAHVRAGRTLGQSLGEVADDLPEPIRSAVRAADAAMLLGAPAADALSLVGAESAAVVAAAVSAQLRAGGDLAALLDGLAETLLEREAQRRAAAVLTAQARATARMVAAMPVVAVGGLAIIDRAAFVALAGSPLGLAAMLASAGLTAAGLLLVRRIASVV